MQLLANQSDQSIEQEQVLSLSDFLKIVYLHRVLMAVVIGLFIAMGIIYSNIKTPMFRAEAIIMPSGGKQTNIGALAAGLQGIGSLTGLGLGGGASARNQLLVILESRTLVEKIVKDNDLFEILLSKDYVDPVGPNKDYIKMTDAVGAFGRYAYVDSDAPRGTIVIVVEHPDAKISSRLANLYVAGLQSYLQDASFTAAKRSRKFVEEQLEKNKQQLLEAGKVLNAFYKDAKISSVESKVDVPISSDFDFLNDLELLKTRREELSQKIKAVKDVPQQVYLEYLTMQKNILTQINQLLSQQYQSAKIDEAKEELTFQVIDPAREPLGPFKPNKNLIITLFFIMGLFFSVIGAFLLHYYQQYIKKQA